jgi:hypothetical protein
MHAIATAVGWRALVRAAVPLADPDSVADRHADFPPAFDLLLDALRLWKPEKQTLRAGHRGLAAVGMIERERLEGGKILDGRPRETRDPRLDGAPGVGGEALAPWQQQGDQQRATRSTHALLYRPRRAEVNARVARRRRARGAQTARARGMGRFCGRNC